MGKDNFKKYINILNLFQSLCRNRSSKENQEGKYIGWNKIPVYHVFASLPLVIFSTA